MKFDIKQKDTATILALKDRKLDQTVSGELKAEFLVLGKDKETDKLVIDLKAVEFCDSSGLSALLIADRTMKTHGGTVHLVAASKKIVDLLKMSHLDHVFTFNKTVAEALKA